ncbi:MAG: DMT family transporter, partial [Oscillospiraceae bacterium]
MISKLSPLFIVIAGCLWGTMGIFVRKLNEVGIESMSIVFIRALFTAAITFALTAIRNRELLKIKLHDVWIFAGTGLVSIVLFNFCYFTAISMMSLSAAAILLYTSPIFVMLLSAVIYKERITFRKIIAVVLSLAGLSLVTGIFGGAQLTPAGIVIGLLSAFGYAMYSIFGRAAINRGYSSLTTTAWSFAFAAFFSAFFADYGAIFDAVSQSVLIIPYTIVFAMIASVAPYILYSLGLHGTETGKAAVIASVEPIA